MGGRILKITFDMKSYSTAAGFSCLIMYLINISHLVLLFCFAFRLLLF